MSEVQVHGEDSRRFDHTCLLAGEIEIEAPSLRNEVEPVAATSFCLEADSDDGHESQLDAHSVQACIICHWNWHLQKGTEQNSKDCCCRLASMPAADELWLA